jgi:hypothetical protein
MARRMATPNQSASIAQNFGNALSEYLHPQRAKLSNVSQNRLDRVRAVLLVLKPTGADTSYIHAIG